MTHKALPAEPQRFLGLELAGAKNQKTAIAALEYYPREQKIFLLDIYDRISGHDDQTGDEALLELLEELRPGVARIGVNVPLTLPPCVTCTRRVCPLPAKCTVPAVRQMREYARRETGRGPAARGREFTPYTQRPIELWIRRKVLGGLPESHQFVVDEALGGNKAPLTARMHFLKWHLSDFKVVEAWPKLTVALLSAEFGVHRRTIESYRRLEEGVHARAELLEKIAEECGIFIYERDLRKLSHSLTAFDAFICAYTALLSDSGHCVKMPPGFPASSGWVEFPRTRVV
jgi:hypothetical protein